MLTLGTAQAGAELRYTLDHTLPTATSPLYSSPIAITATTDLRVQTFVQGMPVGEPQTAVYVARNFDQMHDLPVLVLDSFGIALDGKPTQEGGGGAGAGGGGTGPGGAGGAPIGGRFGMPQAPMVTREFIDAAALLFEPAGATTSLAAAPAVATPSGFHVRGQSSASYDKKPFRLELRGADSSDRDCELAGMPRESDWVLHSPFPDKALIRNAFVFSLGREMGLQAPRTAFVELYLNLAKRPLASSDYQGVYVLMETIKNQKARLNLQQLKPKDTMLPAIGGGYIFKFDWQVMDIEQELVCPTGLANCWKWIEVVDPSPWVPEQTNYLTAHLSEFVTALHSAAPSDATTGYPAFIDVGSFVDSIIVNEFGRNMDAFVRSQFFYKDRGGKIFAGPLWDFDLIAGVGSSSAFSNMSTEGFQYESNAMRITQVADWFPLLLANPEFHAQLVARWKQLRQGLLAEAQIDARIQQLTAGLSGGAGRNFQKWANLTTQRIGFFDTPVADTWAGQVEAMRSWLLQRAAWLDGAWQ